MPRGASPERVQQVVEEPGKQAGRPLLQTIGKELPDIDTDQEFFTNWKISKQEEERILKEFFEELVSADLYRPDHDKYYIRRFLRARQHDIPKAKQFYAEHLKWRKENGVDEIMTSFDFHERDVFLTLYPQGYHKTDKQGRPIYIQHLGAINIKKLTEVTTEDRMLKFHIQEYERCMKYIMQACSRVSGHHVDQTFAVIDVNGVGMSHMTGQVKALLSKITAIDQSNYPEMMGKTLIINTPGAFKFLWGIVKRFLDARTLTKIELHGTNYQTALLKYVAADNLPEYLGGNSKATLLDDVGPWKDQGIIDEIDADYRTATSPDADSTARQVKAAGAKASSGRPTSPARRSMSRVSSRSNRANYQPPTQSALGAIRDSDTDRFSDAQELQARSGSFASEEDGYYSPRSDSNFSSFTEGSGAQPEGESGHPRLNAADAKTANVHERHMSLAMRIRRLENALPRLREKLAAEVDPDKFVNGGFTATGGNDTLGRVEALEDAIEILFTIEEEKLGLSVVSTEKPQNSPETTYPEEKGKSSCGCCTIM